MREEARPIVAGRRTVGEERGSGRRGKLAHLLFDDDVRVRARVHARDAGGGAKKKKKKEKVVGRTSSAV